LDTIVAPNGKCISASAFYILTFGLKTEETKRLESIVATENYIIQSTDDIRDLIAIEAIAAIVNATSINIEDQKAIFEYYMELKRYNTQTVFWLGYPKPPHNLRSTFYCYESFPEIEEVLKYRLLSARRKEKKTKVFSKNISDCLLILSMIRSTPGIRTRTLSEKTELSERTVQRHVAALQAAGEWIEYDTVKRGWQLQYGVSILFGDLLEE